MADTSKNVKMILILPDNDQETFVNAINYNFHQLANLANGVVAKKGDKGDQGLPGIKGADGKQGDPGSMIRAFSGDEASESEYAKFVDENNLKPGDYIMLENGQVYKYDPECKSIYDYTVGKEPVVDLGKGVESIVDDKVKDVKSPMQFIDLNTGNDNDYYISTKSLSDIDSKKYSENQNNSLHLPLVAYSGTGNESVSHKQYGGFNNALIVVNSKNNGNPTNHISFVSDNDITNGDVGYINFDGGNLDIDDEGRISKMKFLISGSSHENGKYIFTTKKGGKSYDIELGSASFDIDGAVNGISILSGSENDKMYIYTDKSSSVIYPKNMDFYIKGDSNKNIELSSNGSGFIQLKSEETSGSSTKTTSVKVTHSGVSINSGDSTKFEVTDAAIKGNATSTSLTSKTVNIVVQDGASNYMNISGARRVSIGYFKDGTQNNPGNFHYGFLLTYNGGTKNQSDNYKISFNVSSFEIMAYNNASVTDTIYRTTIANNRASKLGYSASDIADFGIEEYDASAYERAYFLSKNTMYISSHNNLFLYAKNNSARIFDKDLKSFDYLDSYRIFSFSCKKKKMDFTNKFSEMSAPNITSFENSLDAQKESSDNVKIYTQMYANFDNIVWYEYNGTTYKYNTNSDNYVELKLSMFTYGKMCILSFDEVHFKSNNCPDNKHGKIIFNIEQYLFYNKYNYYLSQQSGTKNYAGAALDAYNDSFVKLLREHRPGKDYVWRNTLILDGALNEMVAEVKVGDKVKYHDNIDNYDYENSGSRWLVEVIFTKDGNTDNVDATYRGQVVLPLI